MSNDPAPQSAEIQRYFTDYTSDHFGNRIDVVLNENPHGDVCMYADAAAALAKLSEERDALKAERDQWKANHDNAVAIKKAVLERPDLGDRVPRVVALTAQLSAALAEVERVRGALEEIEAGAMEQTTEWCRDLVRVALIAPAAKGERSEHAPAGQSGFCLCGYALDHDGCCKGMKS